MATSSGPIEDIVKSEVTTEGGEMYLFQWLSLTEKRIGTASIPDLKEKQASLESTFTAIITATDSYPVPGRALRNLVARCFIALYKKVETRTLFDTIQALMKVTLDFKTGDRDSHKIAAFSCIGDLMETFGTQYMSFMAEIATVSIKTARNSSNPLLRYHALVALAKALLSARRAVTDAIFKDMLKQMKNCLTDKSLPVQRAAAKVLIAMYSGSDKSNNPSPSDVDAIITSCVRSLDGADQVTRHSHAQLVGHILATTQTLRVVPPPDPPKTAKKDPANLVDEDDAAGPGSAAVAEVTKPLFEVSEMFLHLSVHINKPNITRKTRVGIFEFYAELLTKLGADFVENNYSIVVAHFLNDIVCSPRPVPFTRYENLLMRTLVGTILRDLIGVRMLSEQGQIGAIQELSSAYLKRWPAMMPGQSAPNSSVLAIILREVAGLLQQLGNAPPPVQDAVSEPLVTLLTHPSHSIRVAAAWALRCFCYSTPLRLPRTIISVMEMLQRDLSSLLNPAAPSDINLRALGHAYGLAGLVCVIPERPLYASYDVSAKVLDMAIQLLKRAGEHDVKVAGIEVEVAWTLIASLMSLGPNFVRPHLPQLLVLWRNALPKPTSKDNGTGRSIADWMFLLHVRESALGAMLCFLRHNASTLVTLDVGRRIASVLGNALVFANNFISLNIEEPTDIQPPPNPHKTSGLTLKAIEAMLRRRVYQCFGILGFSSIAESTQTTLLQSVVSLFASADGYSGSTVQAAIASGSFTSLWQCTDGYAYGVTFSDLAESEEGSLGTSAPRGSKDRLNRDTVEVAIDSFLRQPVLGACEHDPLTLCHLESSASFSTFEPPPPATAVVDSAIELFSQLLPIQDLNSTVRTLTQLIEAVKSSKLDKNAGRKAAVSINSVLAIVLTLRNVSTRQARDIFGNTQVTSLLLGFLQVPLVDTDHELRSSSSEAMGRLASFAGTQFLTSQIKLLVDQVVNNRDPSARAGCALAFGAIYSHVGGLAAGPLLKTIVNVLMSLGNDPHPVVHYWALNALASVINAASLGYAPFVSSTLGMLLKVYLMDSHEREGGTLLNANMSGDYPAYPVVCEIIDAVITVLGPDIQESARTRSLVLNLVHELSLEDDEGIRVVAIKCFQHFLMFAPEHVDIPSLVNRFRSYLSSPRRPLKAASINALYQLVQKDALAMSKLGGDRLVEDLFGMLDDDSSVQGVKNVITSWLDQTVVYNPSAWIDLCQRIMARTTASQRVADAAGQQGGRDDEGESLNVGGSEGSGRGHSTSRWRTQLFALQCLHQICTLAAASGRREHLDVYYARAQNMSTNTLLVSRVSDLIRMAFTASTAYVTEIRLEGLVVLRDVIQIFAKSPDPAFEDALLLEQHQAPITAALTPAFSSDSTPEILASAVHACAVFVGCGVVKDIGRMGRILKLLTTALEQSKDSGMVSLGETGELSPNASAMLRISTLSAWAQLEVASLQESYLSAVLGPYRAPLASLWISSLRDYATIRVDSESLQDSSSVAIDSSYSSLGKEVLLPYYSKAWSLILQAVATAMKAQDPHILAAMDGAEPNAAARPRGDEPAQFFFVIFGLVYEALASSSSDSTSSTSTREASIIASLQTLKCLVRPEYAGKAILEPTIFDEFIGVSYRLAMTESAKVQIHLLEMLAVFAASQERSGEGVVDILAITSPRAHCLRICAHLLQSTVNSRGAIIRGDTTDRILMVSAAFAAYASIASSITTSQREDVRSVGVLLYSGLLKDQSSELDLVGPTLPSLKTLLELPLSSARDAPEKYNDLIHGLLSACLLNVDEMQGRDGVVALKKTKNNLLASVLILTVLPARVQVSSAAIDHCCFLISQKLTDVGDMSLTAAHCAKTLMVASTSGHVILRHCSKLLIPGLISFVAKLAPAVHDGTISEPHAAAIGEVWKAFSALFMSVGEQHQNRLLGVFLPTITMLLGNQQQPPPPVVAQSITQLLAFASASPTAFKEAADKLDPSVRELLEQSIRRAVGGTTSIASSQSSAKPQISLRSF